jgi:2,3-bisphosphoglycerate-dependent phosphoglycerate mutase
VRRECGRLLLLRHGDSQWNASNRFTGWVDVDLSDAGEVEARVSGDLIRKRGLLPDLVHTSMLRRAIRTADIALDACDRHWVAVRRSWRLNERHYGALQGRDKRQVLAQFGEQQFDAWRRSYVTPLPPIDAESSEQSTSRPPYGVPPELAPRSESLADVEARLLPYWQDEIVPDLRRGLTIAVFAHSNSLRALVKHLDGISDEAVVHLNIPTGIPLLYEFDALLQPSTAGGEYLDAEAARKAIEVVRNQGRR